VHAPATSPYRREPIGSFRSSSRLFDIEQDGSGI
jgi:hypothetical protein